MPSGGTTAGGTAPAVNTLPSSLAVANLPRAGSKDAPKTFKGKYSEVEDFLEYYESLCQQKGVTDDEDKIKAVTRYVSRQVKELLRTLASYRTPNWRAFKDDLLRYYDADRSTKQYTQDDLALFKLRSAKKTIRTLEEWRQYTRRFQRISGWLVDHGVIGESERAIAFWKGIHPRFQDKMMLHLTVDNPNHDYRKPFGVDKVNKAAETLLQRDRFDAEHQPSDIDTANSSVDSESDNEGDSILYYRAYKMDPFIVNVIRKPVVSSTPPSPPNATVPAQRMESRPTRRELDCFGCGGKGHGVRDCPDILQLLADGKIAYDGSGRVVMKDGSRVARMRDEPIAQAVRRLMPLEEALQRDPPPHTPMVPTPIVVSPPVLVDPADSDAFMEDEAQNKQEIRPKKHDLNETAPKTSGEGTRKRTPKQSDVQAHVSQEDILNRVLGTSVSLKIGEVLAISKEMTHQLQGALKPKPPANPIVASSFTTQARGTLIRLRMECDGMPITAIIDTGSQLNIAHRRVWKSTLNRPMDITQSVKMNDANGG
ncbi:hypothetical protein WOLCODRAFT_86390, partial [Wolfiporia cocos MD-104 SS10]